MSQSPKSPAGKDVSLFSGSPGPMKPKASILDEPVDKAKPLDMSSSGSKGPYGKESVFGDSPKEKAKEKKRKKSADKDKDNKRLKTHKKWEFSPMLEKDAWVLWSKVLLWPPPTMKGVGLKGVSPASPEGHFLENTWVPWARKTWISMALSCRESQESSSTRSPIRLWASWHQRLNIAEHRKISNRFQPGVLA